MTTDRKSLQQEYSPQSICFGCGPSHESGLHINSFVQDDETVVSDWEPDFKYEAFEGTLYGGIIGCLFDCHCNWTAAYHLMKRNGLSSPPCTVTAKFAVKFLRPTPSNQAVHMVARVLDVSDDRATVSGEMQSAGIVCATFEGTFVAVKPGHPAYHRW